MKSEYKKEMGSILISEGVWYHNMTSQFPMGQSERRYTELFVYKRSRDRGLIQLILSYNKCFSAPLVTHIDHISSHLKYSHITTHHHTTDDTCPIVQYIT